MTSGSIQGVSIVDRRMARLGIDLAPCSSLWSCFTSQAHFREICTNFWAETIRNSSRFSNHLRAHCIPLVSPWYPVLYGFILHFRCLFHGYHTLQDMRCRCGGACGGTQLWSPIPAGWGTTWCRCQNQNRWNKRKKLKKCRHSWNVA